MKLISTSIPELVIVEPQVFEDERGWFMESFNEERFCKELQKLGLPVPGPFVQDNHSCSAKGVLRGMHYQLPPHAQGKLVRVAQGAVYDVAVDVREGSPTFGQSVGVELSAANKRMLWIPEGFAHGFLSLEDDTHFLYKTTDIYSKECEASVKWDDPALAINWPLLHPPLLNEKDAMAPSFVTMKTMPSAVDVFKSNKCIDLRVIGDIRGSLIALQQGGNIPFKINRAYYIYGTKSGVSRGFHAHKRLKQLAVCVAGKCRMILDDGKTREEVWLDSPNKALLISNMIWREMHDFSEDCVLVVFASEPYDPNDYIRNYEQFVDGTRKPEGFSTIGSAN